MKQLIKPPRLRAGDTVATVSLSWGGAGDSELLWRYKLGKRRLRQLLGLHVMGCQTPSRGQTYSIVTPRRGHRI